MFSEKRMPAASADRVLPAAALTEIANDNAITDEILQARVAPAGAELARHLLNDHFQAIRTDLEIMCRDNRTASPDSALAIEIKNKKLFHPTVITETFDETSWWSLTRHQRLAEEGIIPIRDAIRRQGPPAWETMTHAAFFVFRCIGQEWRYTAQRGQKYGIVTSGNVSIIIELDWEEEPRGRVVRYKVFRAGEFCLMAGNAEIRVSLCLMIMLLALLNLKAGRQPTTEIMEYMDEVATAGCNWSVDSPPTTLEVDIVSDMDMSSDEGNSEPDDPNDETFMPSQESNPGMRKPLKVSQLTHDHLSPLCPDDIRTKRDPHSPSSDTRAESMYPNQHLKPIANDDGDTTFDLPYSPKNRKLVAKLKRLFFQTPKKGYCYHLPHSQRLQILYTILWAIRKNDTNLREDLLPFLWPRQAFDLEGIPRMSYNVSKPTPPQSCKAAGNGLTIARQKKRNSDESLKSNSSEGSTDGKVSAETLTSYILH